MIKCLTFTESLMFTRNLKIHFSGYTGLTFQGPVLHLLWKCTITQINQFYYFNHKVNFSTIALIVIEMNGIHETTFNHIMEYTFVATLTHIQTLNWIFFHAVKLYFYLLLLTCLAEVKTILFQGKRIFLYFHTHWCAFYKTPLLHQDFDMGPTKMNLSMLLRNGMLKWSLCYRNAKLNLTLFFPSVHSLPALGNGKKKKRKIEIPENKIH